MRTWEYQKSKSLTTEMNYRGNDHYRGGGGRDHSDTRRRMDDDRRHPVVPGFTFVNLCESTVERRNLQRSRAANDSTSLGLKNIGEERWVILKSEVVRPGSLCMSDRIRSFIASPTKSCKQYVRGSLQECPSHIRQRYWATSRICFPRISLYCRCCQCSIQIPFFPSCFP